MGQKRKAGEAQINGHSNGAKRSFKEKTVSNGFSAKKRDADRKPRLKFKLRPDWHAAELPSLPESRTESNSIPESSLVTSLKSQAVALLDAENELADNTIFQDSSHRFMTQIMATGTLEDKVSALTLAIQESPLHTKKMFENLLGQAKKKSRNHAMMALAALKDLMSQGHVLPADRKLRYFGKQPALIAVLQENPDWFKGQPLPGGIQEVHLLYWAYEDWLKQAYFELIQTLEGWCNDEIEFTRTRALGYVFELLKEKPEQEENLLRLLVNKLGDKTKRVASRASYLLLQLEQTHPNMKEIVTKAIESDILFRPGQEKSAKYYAIITLNQTVLSNKDKDLPRVLLEIYFGLFRALLKEDSKRKTQSSKNATKNGKKLNRRAIQRMKDAEEALQAEEDMREKLTAQVLTGVNRAFPFADLNTSTFDAQLEALYRIAHSSNFNTGVQALILIQMITQSKNVTADRYYRTLYESLLDPRLFASKQQVMYLNLLYKSLKSDLSMKRVQAFVKRILQVITLHEPSFACSALYLVAEIAKEFPSIETMLSSPEALEDDEDEHFVDVVENGLNPDKAQQSTDTKEHDTHYDSRKRDPLHANADRSCLWELLPTSVNFHPSVSLFASRLLEKAEMPPKPDPTLHTLMHFLDRFVYRNAKSKAAGMRGSSIMQPLAGAEGVDILIKDRSGAATEAPLNTEAFWSRKLEDVPVDEVFFHQYFAQEGKNKKAKKTKKQDDDQVDITGEGSDAGEDEIWDAMVNSRPDIEGDSDDEGFSDMEELMGNDEDLDLDMDDDEDVELNLESDEEVFSNDGGVELNLESDDEAQEGMSDDEGDIKLADLESDDDAILGSDDEIPVDVEPVSVNSKEKKASKGGMTKRKLKQLPLYASVEDYAALLGDDDEHE